MVVALNKVKVKKRKNRSDTGTKRKAYKKHKAVRSGRSDKGIKRGNYRASDKKLNKIFENFVLGNLSRYLTKKYKLGLESESYRKGIKNKKPLKRIINLNRGYIEPKYIKKLDIAENLTRYEAVRYLDHYTSPQWLNAITPWQKFQSIWEEIKLYLTTNRQKSAIQMRNLSYWWNTFFVGISRVQNQKWMNKNRMSNDEDYQRLYRWINDSKKVSRQELEDEIMKLTDMSANLMQSVIEDIEKIYMSKSIDKSWISNISDVLESNYGLGYGGIFNSDS